MASGQGQDGPCAASLQVNRTFEGLALLRDVQEVWGVLGPQLFDFMNDSANVAMLQVGLGAALCAGASHAGPGMQVETESRGGRADGPHGLKGA